MAGRGGSGEWMSGGWGGWALEAGLRAAGMPPWAELDEGSRQVGAKSPPFHSPFPVP